MLAKLTPPPKKRLVLSWTFLSVRIMVREFLKNVIRTQVPIILEECIIVNEIKIQFKGGEGCKKDCPPPPFQEWLPSSQLSTPALYRLWNARNLEREKESHFCIFWNERSEQVCDGIHRNGICQLSVLFQLYGETDLFLITRRDLSAHASTGRRVRVWNQRGVSVLDS